MAVILTQQSGRQPAGQANRGQLIKASLGRLRAIPIGQSIPDDELTQARYELDLVISELSNEGLNLWNWDTLTLFTVKGQSKYQLGVGGDHWTLNPTQTALNGALAVLATTWVVTTTSGMKVGDNISVVTEDGLRFWTTIESVADDTTLTVSVGVPSIASDTAKVYFYTSRGDRPLKIKLCERRDESNTDTPILVYSKEEYRQLPTKFSNGEMNIVYYDPKVTLGELNVWNPPDDSKGRLELSALMPMLGFRDDLEEVDFPKEWYMAIVDYLTTRLCPYYGQLNELSIFKRLSDESLDRAKGFNLESSSVFLQSNEDYENRE